MGREWRTEMGDCEGGYCPDEKVEEITVVGRVGRAASYSYVFRHAL